MAVQLRLLGHTRFPPPLGRGLNHYVPILKALPGEIAALEQLPKRTWERVTPLIEVSTNHRKSDRPAPRSRLPKLPSQLAQIFSTYPFFLEFPNLTPTHKTQLSAGGRKTEVRTIEFMLQRCEELDLNFIPVLRLSSTAASRSLFRQYSSEERGFCIRLPMVNVFDPIQASEALESLMADLSVQPKSVDIVMDLGYIKARPGFDNSDLQKSINQIPWIHEWRSLILVGTVVPQTLAGFDEDQITPIPRQEWRIWTDLQELTLPRIPTFGDYGIQHPERPSGVATQVRASIRYSTADTLIIARGHSLIPYGRGQYHDICENLVKMQQYRGPDFSWGDNQISLCADGLQRPGSLSMWRAVGTSHHIHVMVEALENWQIISDSQSRHQA
jgi:hypothetical protein